MTRSPSYATVSQESLLSARQQRKAPPTVHIAYYDDLSRHKSGPPTTMTAKLGWFCTISLATSSVGIIASIGFISFMWFAHDSNPTWQLLASRDWMTKAIAVSALVLRTSIALQAAVATAMLASLTLERKETLLSQVASISTIRNSNAGPYTLAWFLLSPTVFRRVGARALMLPALAILLVATTSLSQLTSTALLSDTNIGLVATPRTNQTLSAHIAGGYGDQNLPQEAGPWYRKPSTYVSFAERSVRPGEVDIVGKNFTDTGRSLRAFLPFTNQADRLAIKDYDGPATVVDTRVVCFAPNFTLSSAFVSKEGPNFTPTQISGTIEISKSLLKEYNSSLGYRGLQTSRLVDYSADFVVPAVPAIKGQLIARPVSINQTFAATPADLNVTASTAMTRATITCRIVPGSILTLCQLRPQDTGSYLISELSNNTSGSHYSPGHDLFTQYLVAKIVTPLPLVGDYNAVQANTSSVSEGEWTRITFDQISPALPAGSPKPQMDLSLCYNSLTALDTRVRASSNSTRKESLPIAANGKYDFAENGKYDFAEIRKQMGQSDPTSPPNARGLLELTLPDDFISSGRNTSAFISAYAQTTPTDPISLGVPLQLFKTGGTTPRANTEIASFIDEMLSGNSSLGFAMQSAITVLAGMAYYEQLPSFDEVTTVQITRLVQAQIPAGKGTEYASIPAGATRGWVLVVTLTFLHVCLMMGIVTWFLLGTKLSMLGNSWAAVSQVVDPVTDRYIREAALATDREVERWMLNDGVGEKVVSVEMGEKDVGTRIIGISERVEKINQGVVRRRTARVPEGGGPWL